MACYDERFNRPLSIGSDRDLVSFDLSDVVTLVHDVAERVHLPLFGTSVEQSEKSPGELVSEVDKDAELLLTRGLAALTPGVPVIGEEAVSSDPALMQALTSGGTAWVVDPLDGTAQFVAGSRDHAVMVALVDRGQTVAAVVHQPQHGHTYSAEIGAGAFCNGSRAVQPQDPQNCRPCAARSGGGS